jgi:D-glycero-alpha-D-manno-heptose-7-phosphate kinase
MIVSSTPLRVSFVGGGTDIPDYYQSNGGGAVVNAAIDKYVYVIVNKKFDGQVRVSYSKTENVPTAEDLQHPLVKEALKLLDIHQGVEIAVMADIPSHGTGLGSSSSFTVGLLNALHTWVGENASPSQLAEEAVRIEREIVKDPGGKQDQYIAAYGGIRFIQFHPDGKIDVSRVTMKDKDWHSLEESLLLFYTGRGRAGTPILAGQIREMSRHWEHYDAIRNLAHDFYTDLQQGRIERLGLYMHENWERKKLLYEAISDPEMDEIYSRAMAAGATGGKITGAGGGGYLLLCVPPKNRELVRKALADLREEHFHFDRSGSQVVFVR